VGLDPFSILIYEVLVIHYYI